jgi:hypothetical protein
MIIYYEDPGRMYPLFAAAGTLGSPHYSAIKHSRTAGLAVDHSTHFYDALNRLKKGSTILCLTDNCGEIVYDSLLIENLHQRGFKIIIAVKDGPVINDALIEDAGKDKLKGGWNEDAH